MINIQKNIPLAPFTTFRIGGPAKFFAEVKNEEELIEALKYAKDNKLEFFVMGGGSNLLVSDKGYNGIVIRCKISNFKFQISNSTIEAGAGISVAKLVKESMENNLSGMEWAIGIPGTIGGAARGNAGAFGGDIGQVIKNVKVLDIDKIFTKDKKELRIKNYELSDCKFGYRSSIFKQNKNLIILSVVLKLQKGDKEESLKKMREIIQQRIDKQPKGFSAGSFFVNPVAEKKELLEEFEREMSTKSNDGKVPAGWLIENVGLKGKKIGGAIVSDVHPNYILNTGDATAEDVIMLASFIKQQVRDKFGVELREEVQYLGF